MHTTTTSKVSVLLSVFHLPKLRLSTPSISRPSWILVYAFAVLTYFLVFAGIIYDMINQPPSIGMTTDATTGKQRPVAFLQHRINGQYIIEGLTAAFMFVAGGSGFVMLDRATNRTSPKISRYLLALFGVLLVITAYIMSGVFLRIKIPGY